MDFRAINRQSAKSGESKIAPFVAFLHIFLPPAQNSMNRHLTRYSNVKRGRKPFYRPLPRLEYYKVILTVLRVSSLAPGNA